MKKILFLLSGLAALCLPALVRAQSVGGTATRIRTASPAPSGACSGQGQVRVNTGVLYICDGANWVAVVGGSGTTISGTPVAGQFALWASASAVKGSTNFTASVDSSSQATFMVGYSSAAVANRGFIRMLGYGASAGVAYPQLSLESGRGTALSPTATQSSDPLGEIWFYGRAGISQTDGALIQAQALETWTASTAGTRLNFKVTRPGALAVATKASIEADSSSNGYLYLYGSGTNKGAVRYNDTATQLQSTQDGTTFTTLGGTLFANAAQTSITASTITSLKSGTATGSDTLGANALTAGRTVVIEGGGVYTITGSATQPTFTVKFGSTTLATGQVPFALGGRTNGNWMIRIFITCHTTGATGTVQVSGNAMFDDGGSPILAPIVSTSAVTIDTTVTQQIDLLITWGGTGSTLKTNTLEFKLSN